jgi:hypothetical protein
MSKARAPKPNEEYVPPNEIEEFRNKILKAGRHLASVSSVRFPDAERVSEATEKVLNVVKEYKLVGRWVTSRVNNTEEEYMTTRETCQVSFCVLSLLINAMRDF